MASRRPTTPPAKSAARLTHQQIESGIGLLNRRIEEVKKFQPTAVRDQFNIPELNKVKVAIDDTLVRVFGGDTLDYDRYRKASDFNIGPIFADGSQHLDEIHTALERSKARSIALLEQAASSLAERLELDAPTAPSSDTLASNILASRKIFLVHGRDDGEKQRVARFLEKLAFTVVILHEQANKGRTLITKFQEESADVAFAVALLTADDIGAAHGEANRSRARQNVVFELGFFIGRLGPQRVVALLKGDIERPSDIDGVAYISLDKGDWKMELGRELQAAGLTFDWNAAMA